VEDDLGPSLSIVLMSLGIWLVVTLLVVGSVVGLVWSLFRERSIQGKLRDLPESPD
jgi:hypothetical protein